MEEKRKGLIFNVGSDKFINFSIFLSFQILMNVHKAFMNVTLKQLVKTLKGPTPAHVLVAMWEMENIVII